MSMVNHPFTEKLFTDVKYNQLSKKAAILRCMHVNNLYCRVSKEIHGNVECLLYKENRFFNITFDFKMNVEMVEILTKKRLSCGRFVATDIVHYQF